MAEESIAARASFWRCCNICKKEISYGAVYYTCSVSTCRNKRTGLIFCSILCYDGHLGFARHRDSYCEESRAPAS